MGHWITSQIKSFLESLDEVKEVRINPPGGDYDSSNLYVEINSGEPLFVCACMSPETEISLEPDHWDDLDAPYVEISSGKDSRGGLVGVKSPNTIMAHARMLIYFQSNGFVVIPTIDDLF